MSRTDEWISYYRRRAEEIRQQLPFVPEDAIKARLERLAWKSDRMAANLERGWPLDS
jgi:hypothetical protein